MHYSFIGRVDLTVCGNSDPGTSGLITPFGKMDGLYFDASMEPDDEIFRLRNAIEELAKRKGVTFVKLDFENKEDYYKSLNAFQYFADENIKVYTSSDEDDYTLVVNDDVNL